MVHQISYAGLGAGTQTIWLSVSVSQSVPPVSKTLQVVANIMAASVLPLFLGFSRRTAGTGQREKQVHFSHRSNLPLMPFLSQSPDTLVSIDVDHPDGQGELKGGTPHPKQAVPKRIRRGQHISNLQDGNCDLGSGTVKGKQHELVEPASMVHETRD